jgi:hypothetical protein
VLFKLGIVSSGNRGQFDEADERLLKRELLGFQKLQTDDKDDMLYYTQFALGVAFEECGRLAEVKPKNLLQT